MDTLALTITAILAAILIVREVMWRRAYAALQSTLVASGAQIREQEQLAHVGLLVSGLAQELKGPLQGVIGNTELMIAAGGLGLGSTDELRELQQNASRAAGIVRNLLAFTETAALTRRWQDVNELAHRAVEGIRSELDAAGVRMQLALADQLPLIYVDGRQLEKVIATLLSRPAPATSERREASVTLATRCCEPDDRVVIDIDDRAEADVDEPTWSGDLAACRQIVQAHGGSLEVEHPSDGGYRFHLELPVTAVGADTAAIKRGDSWTTSSISSTSTGNGISRS
jgi:two-component system NtrC family sensor kinase